MYMWGMPPDTGPFWERVTDDHVGVLVMSDVMIDVIHHLLHSSTMKFQPPMSGSCVVCGKCADVCVVCE